jgi:hypothetical protein
VVAKGGGQTYDAPGNPLGGLGEAVVLGPVSINEGVKSSPSTFQDTLLVEVGEIPGMDAQVNKIAWTKNPLSLE